MIQNMSAKIICEKYVKDWAAHTLVKPNFNFEEFLRIP